MAADFLYSLRRAETEAVRAIICDSGRVAAVHQEMCLLYTGQAIAGMLVAALDRARAAASVGGQTVVDQPTSAG